METRRTERQGISKARHENNFTILRVVAAIFVFAGHMGHIRGGTPPLLGSYPIHELGVAVLFVLSGYLITTSWMSDPHPVRYMIRRFFRLWPPFAVMVLVMTFVVGPLLSELGWEGYFQSWYTVYLRNLRFYIVYALPGVFTTLPIPNNVNGSLWTMPLEALLYVVAPIAITLLLLPRKRFPRVSLGLAAVLTVAVSGFDLYLRKCYTGPMVVIYGTDAVAAWHLITFFVIGMLFTYEEVRRLLNVQAGCMLMALLLLFQQSEPLMQYLALYLILPYFLFSFAFAPQPVFRNFGKKLEPSYGIYLYGFLFQQLVVVWQQKHGVSFTYLECLVISLVPSLAAAALSYYLVEKPFLRLSKYLTGKIRRKDRSGTATVK